MSIVINGSGTISGISVGGLPDGTVDAGTLATDSVSAVKIAANSVDSAELIDGSVDAVKLASGVGTGLAEADQWRLTSNLGVSAATEVIITSNLARVNSHGFGKLGTGMTQSSGVFTFPSTGIWLITLIAGFYITNNDSRYIESKIYSSTDGTNFGVAAYGAESAHNSGSHSYASPPTSFMFDVTSTSTHKIKFAVKSENAATLKGTSSYNATHFTFIRLGDT